MHLRRNINSLIRRSNYQIVKVFDSKADGSLPADVLLDDRVLEARISPGRKHAWNIAAPKSGSTWLTALLEILLGWRKLGLAAKTGRNEAEPDIRQILCFPHENLFSPQQHCRASESTVEFINRFRIKPILQGRNIYDTIVSLREHCVNESVVMPMGYADAEFLRYDAEKQFQFLIDMVLPWYFNFYASWLQVEGLAPENLLWVTYDELLTDTPGTLRKILEYVGESRSQGQIEQAIERAKSVNTRKNKAVTGRGKALLTERHKARIKEMRQYYSHIDFSKVGL
jgi:hypothetical protein